MKLCEKKTCTGCLACHNICNHSAIGLRQDVLGFYYPSIDHKKCVECGLCSSVCPELHAVHKHSPKKIYSGWSKNDSIRMDSSSGGAFTEIAYSVLKQGGIVFGCMFDAHFRVIHSYIDNVTDLQKLRRSKYVQSYIGDSYLNAAKFLKAGRIVLFSGTPCQIAGLKAFLKKEYDNLYTVDLVCHGVPSPKLWEDYKQYIENKEQIKIEEIRFRDKKISWIYFHMIIKGGNREYEGNYFKDRWLRVFLSDYYLRDNCYHCKYTSIERVADFTIADWWGYKGKEKNDKGYRKKGVSLILVNTEHGILLSQAWLPQMNLKERTLEEAIKVV